MRTLAALLLCTAPALAAGFPRAWLFNAHNSYPRRGVGMDRLDRARRAGLSAFEIDITWSEARGHTVISHERNTAGGEPTLDEYFFTPMLPALEKMPAGQPGVLLFIDFKVAGPRVVKELHAQLAQHRSLLSSPGRRGDPLASTPVRFGPLTIVLTGDNDAIAQFERFTPAGEPYLAMGNREPPGRRFEDDVARYIPEPASTFYRVFNFEWKHIENAPNNKAGDFTASERARLARLVRVAHEKGYWLRTWNLNATIADWGADHCFGSREAVQLRWRAAANAGVEMIATDEYELAGEYLVVPAPP